MTLDASHVGGRHALPLRSWDRTDALLYAIGVGAGQENPCDELAFTTENSESTVQQVVPTFVTLLGAGPPERLLAGRAPGSFVHAEEELVMHRPLPVHAKVTGSATVERIDDKGVHALVVTRTELVDTAGTPLATIRRSTFVRDGGGFGGARGPAAVWDPPAGPPDLAHRFRLPAGQALVYRLSGDRDRLHSDPRLARGAGFAGPLVHGLCLYGYAARLLIRLACAGDPVRFGMMRARFARPLTVGEHELTLAAWSQADGMRFQMLDGEGRAVLDHGTFRTTGS